jgi:hypothetical protein
MVLVTVLEDKMERLATETIYSGSSVAIPMCDVQHVENLPVSGQPRTGIAVITRNTRWDVEHDCWANSIYIPEPEATRFLQAWCFFRSEIDPVCIEHAQELSR